MHGSLDPGHQNMRDSENVAEVQAPGREGAVGEEPADHAALHPTSPSWLNMVEIFFGIIIRQAIRGSFTSVDDLTTAIENFIDGWNDRCQPFTSTKAPT
jgi:hypothetical protein